MPEIETYQLTRAEIEKIKIPPGSRKTLIKTLEKNVDRRSKSGIWLITDTDWDEAQHAQRWGEVIAVPRAPLPFVVKKPGEEGKDDMPWETAVEISEGMRVWYDYMDSLNSVMYVDEDGSEYKLIDYSNLYVATWPVEWGGRITWSQESTDKKEYIIPLNGYHIFEKVYHEKRSDFDHFSEKKINNKLGVVKYVASNNGAYENGMDTDHVELKVGDKVQFGTVPPVFLEDEYHCFFDGGRMYRRAQARNVDLVWRDGELILPNGRVLLKRIWEDERTPAGIWLPRPDVKTHTGEIIVSSVPECRVGDKVKYVMGAGSLLKYKDEDCRVVRDSQILYVE